MNQRKRKKTERRETDKTDKTEIEQELEKDKELRDDNK